MEKYKQLEVIGKGSFGEVVKAQNTENGEIVAIKTMKQKYSTWDECMNLRELKSLRKLQHKNIIKLKEVLRVQSTLSFVFEHVDTDIYKLYESEKKQGRSLREPQIRSIFYQLTQALSFMHKHGYFHRDLKPENVLFSHKDSLVKLIDFGLAREIRSRPPYTEYVSTRWYRAPELLLRSNNYNSPVDIFALGCIMAELFLLRPLFNGTSEQDQLQKITSVLGTPSKIDWPEGHKLASQRSMTFPTYPAIYLSTVIQDCPPDALQLISECLKWDPQKRPTASKILQHPYFKGVESVLPIGYFSDLEGHKNQQNEHENIQNIHPMNVNNKQNDLNVSFGQEDSKKNKEENNNSDSRNILKPSIVQYSQSDLQNSNKVALAQNNQMNKDTKQGKGIESDSLSYGEYLQESIMTKNSTNPLKSSRLNARNHVGIIRSPENATPSFSERTKAKDSGFNYSEVSPVGAPNKNDQRLLGIHRASSNQPNGEETISYVQPQSNIQHQAQQQSPIIHQNEVSNSKRNIDLNTNNRMVSNNNNNNIYNFGNIGLNVGNSSKLQQRETDKNDILGTFISSMSNSHSNKINLNQINNMNINNNIIPTGNTINLNNNMNINDNINKLGVARSSYHVYSNTQPNARQQQQISSAIDNKRPGNNSTYQYSAIDSKAVDEMLNKMGNKSSIEEGTRPNRQLNSAAYGVSTSSNCNTNFDSLQQFSNIRAVGAGPHFYGSFQNVSPINPINYIPSASGSHSLGAVSLVRKQPPNNDISKQTHIPNPNIYDFNNVKQPIRNTGLQHYMF